MMRSSGLLLMAVVVPGVLSAQNSIYGTRGIGFPGRAEGARSVALGGGAALFDAGSALNPALAAAFTEVSVGASSGTTFRGYTAVNVDVSGLQETRFPFAYLGGGVGRSQFSYQVSLATYTERTFRLTSADTVLVGGTMLGVSDTVLSDGGIVDVRGAVGWRTSPKLNLGAAFHVLAGSSRIAATRRFENDALQRFQDEDDLSFSGSGFSAGVLWSVRPAIRLAAAARINNSLTSRLGDGASQSITMPVSLAGGVAFTFSPAFRWMTTAQWRAWSRSDGDLVSTGSRAFDTWIVGSGIELGGQGGRFPLRVGVRYAQIPFSHNTEQPTEWNFSLGTGTPFASNRAAIDVAVERFQRDGASARERGWYVMVGITITPSR
ncbi:MAG: hypothetical protein IH876_01820 [Gemmatimonadetes bacterium]|nr:hypothetical protein [Gemmatimonadota bacterium]